MHEVVRRNCKGYGTGLQLMRHPMDDGMVLFAFRNGEEYPIWIAKRGEGAVSRRRIDGEKRALEWISPWHARLGVPLLLDAMETPEEIWLVHGGLRGKQRFLHLGSPQQLPAEVLTAADWLHQMQDTVAAPATADLQAIACAWADDADARPDGGGEALWQQVRSNSRLMPAAAAHGNFWVGNLLFERDHIRVIDWTDFHAGNPLDDLLTLLMTTPRKYRGRHLDRMDCFLSAFFMRGAALHMLWAWSQRRGLSAREARFCFYLFLARRLRWELGFGLQSRSQASIAQAQQFWRPALNWLAERNFPDPFHSVAFAD